MAYALGFIYADGSIYPSARGKYIVVTSTDRFIIHRFKKWLCSEHTIVKMSFIEGNRKDRFALRIGNAELYNSLVQLGLYPNKSLTIGMPKIPDTFLKDFVRGYFDGDGCVHLYRSKGIIQKIILRKLTAIFTSGSKKFLKELLEALRKNIELKQTKIYKSSRCFQLRFATYDTVELFKFMYNDTEKELFFKRKFKIFEYYFKLRPVRVDGKVESILQSLSQ